MTEFLDYRVLIAEDFSKVIFSYQDQNYICEMIDGLFSQRELSFLSKRKVKSLRAEGSEIYIFCCKDYDQDLDIYCTSWLQQEPKFQNKKTKTSSRQPVGRDTQPSNTNCHYVMKISRQITKRKIRIFDVIVQSKYSNGGKTLHILSSVDQRIHSDQVDFFEERLMFFCQRLY